MEQQQKHPGGRPTKYTPDMPVRLSHYIRRFEESGDAIPSRPGFADLVGVCENTIANWGKAHEEFLWALRRLRTAQHKVLINKGLNDSYNATICKLILCSNHGYKQQKDTT